MDNVEVPRGRTTAVLLLALLTFGTAVLMMVPFLSEHSKYHISFVIVYAWEILLYVLALIAMLLIFVLRKNNEHLTETLEVMSKKQSVIRCLTFVLFGLASSVLPFYECHRVSTCLNVYDKQLHSLQFASYFCVGVYSICHMIFVPLFYKYRCKSIVTRLLVAVILSANGLLVGNIVLNAIRSLNSEQSQEYYKAHQNSSLHGAFENNSAAYYFQHTLVFSLCDSNGTEIIDRSETTQNVYKYTYPLIGEFVLFSLVFLVPLWNIVTKSDISLASINFNEPAEHDNDLIELNGPTGSRLIVSLKNAFRFISQKSLIFSLIFATIVFGLHITVAIVNEIHSEKADFINGTLTSYNIDYYYLQTIYTYVISIVPFIGYIIARKQENGTRGRFNSDTVLLIVGGCGHLLLVLFETVDSITVLAKLHPNSHLTEDVMYFIKILFHYLGIYFQIKFLLRVSCLPTGHVRVQDRSLHVKGIIIFLGICNAERWLADSFLPPTVLKYANDIQGDDTFGHTNWWIIVRLLFPVVIFYRVWSALVCCKVHETLNE